MVLLVNYSVPTDGIQYTEPNVTVNIESNEVGSGTLYITESSVLWLNPRDEGIQLEYKQIVLHAISRDLTAFPMEHLLCHYEGKLPGFNNEDQQSSDEDDEAGDADFESSLTEIRFVPEKKESLEALFDALTSCQTLHPDSDCQLSEDDFEDADEDRDGEVIYNTEEGMAHLTEEGRANLERFNLMLQVGDADIATRTNQIHISNGHHNSGQPMESDQFQDADDMDG